MRSFMIFCSSLAIIIRVVQSRGKREVVVQGNRNTGRLSVGKLEEEICGKAWACVRSVLKWIRGVDWINLAQDRDKCWAVVNTVMVVLVP
jgi:hypothetical protein